MDNIKRFRWKLFGEWRVIYPCGGVSVLMSYSRAKNYAAIFKGTPEPAYFFNLEPWDENDTDVHLT